MNTLNGSPTPPFNGGQNRLSDWDYQFNELLIEVAKRPFEWGKWDCCIFAGSVIQAITGANPATAFMGEYTDKQEAAGKIREIGASGVFDIMTAIGFDEVPVTLAQRGDIVYHQGHNALGSCKGVYSSFVTSSGLMDLPTRECSKAWHI